MESLEILKKKNHRRNSIKKYLLCSGGRIAIIKTIRIRKMEEKDEREWTDKKYCMKAAKEKS